MATQVKAGVEGRSAAKRKRLPTDEDEALEFLRYFLADFLFSVSHDIRTPMRAILGFADIASRDLGNRELVGDCLDKIRKSGELLFSLLGSALDVSGAESGKSQLVETVGDVRYSFENVREPMTALAEEKGVRLTFSFGTVADRFVYVDFEKCARVFVNIISNAIKYTKAGGRVLVSCEQMGPASGGCASYRYTFEDNGIGMSPEFQRHLFDRFAREDDTAAGGIGLGMSVCKAFVDMMGGTITCHSRKGEGTTITVELPFRLQEGTGKYIDPATGKIVGVDRHASGPPVSYQGKRVLLVDDSKLNREVSRYYLEQAGFSVETAADGTGAVGLVRKGGPGHYDAILMCVQLSVMDGLETTRQIRRWEREGGCGPVPVIALSASAFEEDRAAALAAGMTDLLPKGVKPAVLVDCIAKNL